MSLRHYEIVFLVHPDQSEQVPAMIERYKALIEDRRRQDPPPGRLGPPSAGLSDREPGQGPLRACSTSKCGQNALNELESGFRFNDAVLRHLVVSPR